MNIKEFLNLSNALVTLYGSLQSRIDAGAVQGKLIEHLAQIIETRIGLTNEISMLIFTGSQLKEQKQQLCGIVKIINQVCIKHQKAIFEFQSSPRKISNAVGSLDQAALELEAQRQFLPELKAIIGQIEYFQKTYPANNHKATLAVFIKRYCFDYGTASSKVKTLQGYDRRKSILPKLAAPWTEGQSKFYYVQDLIAAWPDLTEAFPGLPQLKKAAEL